MIAVIIILVIAGIAAIAAGIFMKNTSKEEIKASDEYLEQMLEERINQVEHRIDDVAEKSASTIRNQAKTELEKLSKEKLSEVNEYSDQVMDRINKNHNEVMFLYGLLSDKQKELDETVESLNRAQRQLQIQNENSLKISRNNFENKQKVKIENTQNNPGESDQTEFQKDDIKNVNTEKVIENGDYERRSRILTLAKDGKSELEIAKQLSMGVGEVRLVLELSKGV